VTAPFRMTWINSVPDFERWRSVLGDDPSAGRPGLVRRTVFRSLDDPNEVLVELEFESEEAAKAFIPSLDLRDIMDRSGVEVYPPMFLGREVDELRFEV
jgi:heme-degrading monooxygenase HmoA